MFSLISLCVSNAIATPFKSTAYAVGITAENMATGDFFTVSNKTVNSFDVLFKNSSGTNISRNFDFKAIDKKDFNCSESFNPNKVKTNREKYVIDNQLDIFEKIYMKIWFIFNSLFY